MILKLVPLHTHSRLVFFKNGMKMKMKVLMYYHYIKMEELN